MPPRITFIIGNGFDLGLDMRTSYVHFYKDTLSTLKKSDNPIIEEILRIFETDDDAGQALWSDLEKALGSFVPNEEYSDLDYISAITSIISHLQNHLLKEQEKVSLGTVKVIAEQMINAVVHFHDIGNNLTPNDTRRVQSVINSCLGSIEYSFISFNYTDAFDKCVRIMKAAKPDITHVHGNTRYNDKIGDVFHVHGRINEGIILGVDNNKQITDPRWNKSRHMQRTLVKTSLNGIQGSDRTALAETMINESVIIILYGLSLGETDQRWWKRIFNWLNGSNNRLLIIAQHFDLTPEEMVRLSIPNEMYLRQNEGAQSFIKAAVLSPEDWNKVSDRVIFTQNPNWFSFNKDDKNT